VRTLWQEITPQQPRNPKIPTKIPNFSMSVKLGFGTTQPILYQKAWYK
jgi:hypothetical protein